jgi:peroxiredoxin
MEGRTMPDRLVFSALAVLLLAGAVFAADKPATASAAEGLKPGDQAPAFSLPGSDGKTYSLADFKGKKAVVLAWFPKAFTGG